MNKILFNSMFFAAILMIGVSSLGLKPIDPKGQDASPAIAKQDTAQIQAWLDKLNRAIEGKADSPATVVFQNIQLFKRMPAGRFLGLMKGWTRTLGVDCAHCHVADAWEKDDKPPKQTARAMDKMEDDVNALIKNVKTIQNEKAHVSCWTCHRGQVKPETNPFRAERR